MDFCILYRYMLSYIYFMFIMQLRYVGFPFHNTYIHEGWLQTKVSGFSHNIPCFESIVDIFFCIMFIYMLYLNNMLAFSQNIVRCYKLVCVFFLPSSGHPSNQQSTRFSVIYIRVFVYLLSLFLVQTVVYINMMVVPF